MPDLAVYFKEGLPFFTGHTSRKLCRLLLMSSTALIHSVSSFFCLHQSPFSSLCTAFHVISSNIDEVLSINPSANVFSFEEFNNHHKDWLTHSGGTDRPSELCYNFLNDLTQIVT